MKTDSELNFAQDELKKGGWEYRGCDLWEDPITGTNFNTGTAYAILISRRSPLILCDDWRGIQKELRKQLKRFGLTVTFKTRREDDQIRVEVKRLVSKDLIAHQKWCDKHKIDPWNCYS